MSICDELKNDFESIKNLKTELDLEFQKEKSERDYSKVQVTKERIEKEVSALQDKLDPIPESLRGKEGIRVEKLEIGGKTVDQLIQEMKKKNIEIGDYVMEILESEDFRKSLLENPNEADLSKQIQKKVESINLIHLKLGDLGFPYGRNPTIDEIYKRIEKLGLALCPPEVGPEYRLKFTGQSMEEWICIGMKPIESRGGNPLVFEVGQNDCGLWLTSDLMTPMRMPASDTEYVFRLHSPLEKLKNEKVNN